MCLGFGIRSGRARLDISDGIGEGTLKSRYSGRIGGSGA